MASSWMFHSSLCPNLCIVPDKYYEFNEYMYEDSWKVTTGLSQAYSGELENTSLRTVLCSRTEERLEGKPPTEMLAV